jgi:hypothetical protein
MSSFPSIVEFTDVKDAPRVRMTLPGPLSLGTKILLNLLVRRKNGNRTEELRIQGEFKVLTSAIDARGLPRQVVSLEATKVVPVWKSVKTPEPPKRKPPRAVRSVLHDPKAPRTVVA